MTIEWPKRECPRCDGGLTDPVWDGACKDCIGTGRVDVWAANNEGLARAAASNDRETKELAARVLMEQERAEKAEAELAQARQEADHWRRQHDADCTALASQAEALRDAQRCLKNNLRDWRAANKIIVNNAGFHAFDLAEKDTESSLRLIGLVLGE
jgi:hypothetical protein